MFVALTVVLGLLALGYRFGWYDGMSIYIGPIVHVVSLVLIGLMLLIAIGY